MPRKRARHDNHGDLISGLPDDILGTIISLLPTREGGKTQLLARSWRPLWRYAPVNICCDRPICSKQYKRISVISDLLSIHRGTTRRFNLDPIRFRTDEEKKVLESWFRSRSFAKLEELIIGFADSKYQLPSSVLLCTSALVVAKISRCVFPKEVTDLPSFPLLKELSLCSVYIAEDVFHGLLSRCHVLESLYLEGLNDTGSFEISSETLTSVGLGNCILKQGELIIKYAPRLERLLLPRPSRGPYILRVIEAPKLQILGLLSPCISQLEIANTLFEVGAPTTCS
ncbi:putative F-box/FBD/LRR-repeat protein At1g78760 isoform X1 [Lolium rigidum]|uniref:putative F-box/FBD/LRR-repeat protein At1g78760 isoform X1 n=1 Tax=Lolium rigidum TaxID=89674 RepID=UPI001F5DB3D4|nr:putative F-box/FBD/LRR-repeat protein At1g78760 isoform X1 [Lolium rigidum]